MVPFDALTFVLSFARRHLRSPEDIRELQDVRDRVLGPEHLLEQDTAFQRHPRAVPLRKSANCYPLGITYQVQRSMSAPAKGAKLNALVLDDDAQMRLDLCKVRPLPVPFVGFKFFLLCLTSSK